MIYVIRDRDGRAIGLVMADGAREAIAKAQKRLKPNQTITAAPDWAGRYAKDWQTGAEVVAL